MPRLLEDYGLIGDGHTAALVSRNGSIDWLCWPRFDSDASFCALLGTSDHGHWTIAPDGGPRSVSRRYVEDTLILETTMAGGTDTGESGSFKVLDFMPMRDDVPRLVRIVAGVQGKVTVRMRLRMRFGYGQVPPWIERHETGLVARIGPDLVVLRAPVPLDVRQDETEARFTIEAGQRLAFVLSYGTSWLAPPEPIDAEASLHATQAFWRDWIGRFDDGKTRWPEAVRRSLITLKAMIYRPSGGLVAAPTTSLPEAPGGTMNWDYRYCWVRDSTFTLGALLNAGYTDEATRWRDWLLRAVGGVPQHIRIMYRVDGGRRLDEWVVDELPGFRHAKPVRVGNEAATQRQIDVLGELLDCLALARRAGVPRSEQEERVAKAVVELIAAIWRQPGSGIWEVRGELRNYTYSTVMAWAGVDRYLRHFHQAEGADRETVSRLAALRARIHDDVCRESWNAGLNTFTHYYGGEDVDASLLLLPLVGFLPANDPRIRSTVDAVARELGEGGLIRREKRRPGGLNEGSFLACSLWMADCLRLQGRNDEAVAQFERVLALRNDVGLLAEEYNVPARHQAGNFPQALTHLALVNTALGLSGPVLDRGGA